MKIQISNKVFDLSLTKVMGVIAIKEQDPRTDDEFLKLSSSFKAAGAELVEIGLQGLEEALSAESKVRLIRVLGKIIDEGGIAVAVNTNDPKLMELAAKAGAGMIVSQNALRSEGALETASKLKLPVCLQFDQFQKIGDGKDIVSAISEFMFERIDACLNAGISRKNLILDPSLGNVAPIGVRLKLLSRLDSLKGFGLPLSIALPRQIPAADVFMEEHPVIMVTLALFCANQETVQIIRTNEVSKFTIALGSWDLMSSKAKPYRLSKGLIRRFRSLRDKIAEMKKNKSNSKN